MIPTGSLHAYAWSCRSIAVPRVQICISDNCSTDKTEAVVRSAQKKINIVLNINY